VLHRGGSCLHVSRNRHKIGRDSTDSTCYPKNLKKRFPITFLSPHLRSGLMTDLLTGRVRVPDDLIFTESA